MMNLIQEKSRLNLQKIQISGCRRHFFIVFLFDWEIQSDFDFFLQYFKFMRNPLKFTIHEQVIELRRIDLQDYVN